MLISLALNSLLGWRRHRCAPRWEVPAWLSLLGLLGPAGVAAQTPPGTRVEYYHLDALGSVRVVTNEAGAVRSRHDYLPFGEEWQGPNPPVQRRLFTGKERDFETGLDDFGARYMRADRGRFTTVDPELNVKDALVDPQRWNRYAYARNNPLRWVDPDGRDPIYANAALKSFFEQLAVRLSIVRETLGLYTGPGRPDLFISQGNAGFDIGGEKAAGSFSPTDYDVVYPTGDAEPKRGMTLEEIENTGTWSITGGKLVIDSSLKIDIGNRPTVEVAAHELGHADHAARDPLGYKRDAAQTHQPNGRLNPHDNRIEEKNAEGYTRLVMWQIRF